MLPSASKIRIPMIMDKRIVYRTPGIIWRYIPHAVRRAQNHCSQVPLAVVDEVIVVNLGKHIREEVSECTCRYKASVVVPPPLLIEKCGSAVVLSGILHRK